MDFDVETFYAYRGELEDKGPRPEIILTPAQLAELSEFAAKFPKLRLGVVDMGRGYVLVRVYDAHDVPVGQKLLTAPPEL